MEFGQLRMTSLYRNQVDMNSYARMIESPTQSYKLYWLDAIMTLLPDKDEMSFKEVVFEMFWETWLTVSQYQLHLGPTIEGKSENLIDLAIHIIEHDSNVKLPMFREHFM